MIQAVIFDLDGTVLDNEGEWEAAFQAVIEKCEVRIENYQTQPNGWIHEPGLGLAVNWKNIFEKCSIVNDQWSIDDLVKETVKQYQSLACRQAGLSLGLSLRLRPGITELVQKIKERGWQTALATSSTWGVVERELEQLELYLAFDVTTTGEEVMMAKPDPEIYLLTAQKLNLEPENCVVIEDAIAGIRAAREAGMRPVGLVSDYAGEEKMMAAGAAAVITSFDDFSLKNEEAHDIIEE